MRLLLLVGCCLLTNGCGGDKFLPATGDRSWLRGEVSVRPYQEGRELGVEVKGKWPGASPDLWIKYRLSLFQDQGTEHTLIASSMKVSVFELSGTGVNDFSQGTGKKIDLKKPVQAVFDYEIWKGEPAKGKLLAKQSVLSKSFLPVFGE